MIIIILDQLVDVVLVDVFEDVEADVRAGARRVDVTTLRKPACAERVLRTRGWEKDLAQGAGPLAGFLI